MPDLVEVAAKFHDQGGRVLTLSHDLCQPGKSWDKVEPRLRSFLREHGYDFPVLVFPDELSDAVAKRFGIGPIPATIAINAKGEIVEVHQGVADADRFEELMRAALGQ